MQITISYGNRNNDDLLQYFGFVEVGCLFDRFVVLDPILILKKEIMNNSQNQNINEIELRELQSAMIILEKDSQFKTSFLFTIIDFDDSLLVESFSNIIIADCNSLNSLSFMFWV